MTNDFQKTGDFRLKGWHVFAGFIAFFGLIIAVNIFMATLASTSWTGLVVKNSYVASQEYNATLEAAKTQHKLGWISKIKYQDGELIVAMQDPDGKILSFDDIAVKIGRPVFEQSDQTLQMNDINPGVYTKDIQLQDGEWVIQILGNKDGHSYRRDARIEVKANKASILE